ncbi:uncharacterized protein LOC123541834 [Mercenaria mercenaria]|uniref:uncharacterized protein LOC123541834 n=1 Tax=Mercenaria mercenaria TaxID=6596 RepID=UPI00234E8263|nr:uncharacterized protein LOC123541834 [Mercenaria mercenaria]
MGRFSIIVCLMCFVFVHGQTTQKVCWDSRWYNDSGVLGNRSSYEHQSINVLNAICSSGSVIAAQCRDDKGEPFQLIKNSSANQYYAVCNHVNGLICHPYNNSQNATCPDYAIQYGCNCPTTTGGNFGGSGVGITTLKTGDGHGVSGYKNGGGGSSGFQTTGSGAGPSVSGQQNSHCRNDGQHYGASHLVQLICTITLKVLF